MAEPELFALIDQVLGALLAVEDAHARARQAGLIERGISLNLVAHSSRDAVLALDELLQAEGTPYQPRMVVAPRVGPGCGRSRRSRAAG